MYFLLHPLEGLKIGFFVFLYLASELYYALQEKRNKQGDAALPR